MNTFISGPILSPFFSILLACSLVTIVHSATLHVPNGSFESPTNDFASPDTASWQKAPRPFWYTDTSFPWEQLIGEFLNTSNGSPDHIDNLDGWHGAYLFALPNFAMYP